MVFNLIGFSRPGVQTELDRFYKAIADTSSFDTISKSAFTQSRRKLKPEAFIELNQTQLAYYKEHASGQKRWKGKRVVAIDGSLLNLPHTEEVKMTFGSVKNQHEEVISARSSFAYDVCNELVLDAIIAPRRSCEKDLAVEHLTQLNPSEDLLVFDRGYPCQWLMGLLDKEGYKFCFRLSSAWKEAYKLMSEGENDIDWVIKRNAQREWGKLRTYGLPKTLEGLRLVSVPLTGGETEILVTNLTDRKEYAISDLKALYNLRWGVEESYKSFKKTLHVEHFSGRTAQAVRQDFHAKVFMLNMASIVRNQGFKKRDTSKTKHDYKLSKTQVLAKVKDFLLDIFYRKKPRIFIQQMLNILKKRTEIIRLDRSFPRPKTSSRRRHKIVISKGI